MTTSYSHSYLYGDLHNLAGIEGRGILIERTRDYRIDDYIGGQPEVPSHTERLKKHQKRIQKHLKELKRNK